MLPVRQLLHVAPLLFTSIFKMHVGGCCHQCVPVYHRSLEFTCASLASLTQILHLVCLCAFRIRSGLSWITLN